MEQFWEKAYHFLDRFMGVNEPIHLLKAMGVVAAAMVCVYIFKKFGIGILKALAKWTKRFKGDDYLVDWIDELKLFFYIFVGLYSGLMYLKLPEEADATIHVMFQVIISFYAVYAVQNVINKRNAYLWMPGAKGNVTLKRAIVKVSKTALWLFAGLTILSNAGFDITAFITGLGLGGLAVAMASKELLSNLLAYGNLVSGTRARIGDMIKVGDILGRLESITTQFSILRDNDGFAHYVPNNTLISSSIKNISNKIAPPLKTFNFGVDYSTDPDILDRMEEIIIDLANNLAINQEKVEVVTEKKDNEGNVIPCETTTEMKIPFEVFRVGQTGFGDSDLPFQVAYRMHTPDFSTEFYAKSQLFSAMVRKFKELGISFPFPSRELYIKNDEGNPIHLHMDPVAKAG